MNQPLLMMGLVKALYWFDDALRVRIGREGWPEVSRAQSLLLANIASGERRASRLARDLGVSRQAISQMLADMEARGLVQIEEDPEDRRARLVSFHPGAADLRDAARRTLAELEEELAGRIGTADVAALRRALAADWGATPK